MRQTLNLNLHWCCTR